jgi:hypothetical protein
MFKSALNVSSGFWIQSYDDKYYNNLILGVSILKIPASSSDSDDVYKIWSCDVTDLVCEGETLNAAKEQFVFNVIERIFNRQGGIYLISSADDIKYQTKIDNQFLELINKSRQLSNTIIHDTVVIFPSFPPGQ